MQFISDYIKFLGGSGVIYKSIFNNFAKNYAIFCNDEHDEKEKFECLEIENVDIKKVGYKLSKYS